MLPAPRKPLKMGGLYPGSGVAPGGPQVLSLTSGQYLELYSFQSDSSSEAYQVDAPYKVFLQSAYLGPA